MEKYYSCHEIAARYGVKIKTVWNWIHTKKLSAVRIGKLYRITDADLEAFEREHVKKVN